MKVRGPTFKHILKGNIPAKMKFFLWLVENNAILTNDNMISQNMKGPRSCYFCDKDENVNHLLLSCCIPRTVWATIAVCLGACDIPKMPTQSWKWCEKWLPNIMAIRFLLSDGCYLLANLEN